MSRALKWASIERGFIQKDLEWLKAGGKFVSPSGEDVTAAKIEELELRLEHSNIVIAVGEDENEED